MCVSAMKWPLTLRMTLIFCVGLFACITHGQSDFFTKMKPEATIVVAQHPMGGDLVEVTVQGANYPQEAINEKVAALGKELGDQPRGLQATVVGDKYVKFTFAVNGLISTGAPRVNVVSLAKAFGFGNHRFRNFSVFFEGVAPDNSTPARWFAPKDAWMLEGMAMKSPAGIDYRIQVNTNDPNDIYMPGNSKLKSGPKQESDGGGSKLFIFGGIIVCAIAIGLLVYSALLRSRPRAR